MAIGITVENRYEYAGEDIEVARFETQVAGFTPWGARLDHTAKITHWPAYIKT